MKQAIICCPRRNDAAQAASKYLATLGLTITDSPGPDVTHLLLPVPSFPAGEGYLPRILGDLSSDVIITGGGLDVPALADHRVVDFLKDPYYLADNAAITADCAIQLAKKETGVDWKGLPVLILGWGRIGKCLARKLGQFGADVTVSARKDADLAMVHALGYRPLGLGNLIPSVPHYRVIFNTVPAMLLPELRLSPGAIALELASVPGMAGDRIISARGLPGKMAPHASGELIARTFIRLAL